MRIAESDAGTTRALRRAVLRPSWPPDSAMHGDDNADAVHFAAWDGEDVVAACLILPRQHPLREGLPDAWQLRGMATLPAYRNRGIGADLLACAVRAAELRGGSLLWCEARSSALRFYAANGFAVDGPEYLHSETSIPHHVMSRRIGPAAPLWGT
jgi:GNAT superfamily N-acetyltransferase